MVSPDTAIYPKGSYIMTDIDRRQFVRRSLLAASALVAGAAISPIETVSASRRQQTPRQLLRVRGGSGFKLWQLDTQCNDIGNSYVLLTDKGRVCVIDGGFKEDMYYLRGFLALLGGHVDTWFLSHPHPDHMGTLRDVLKQPMGISIRRIVHSRMDESILDTEPWAPTRGDATRALYAQFDALRDTEVIDVQQPGHTFEIDGLKVKVLAVQNPDIHKNCYNNSSMVLRAWDKRKSIVFLGDAGVEEGRKLMQSPWAADLPCDYLQMAHHGQAGCDEDFYRSFPFRACLWSTPRWVWDNDGGQGPGSGKLKTLIVRGWMDRLGIKEHHVSWQGLWELD